MNLRNINIKPWNISTTHQNIVMNLWNINTKHWNISTNPWNFLPGRAPGGSRCKSHGKKNQPWEEFPAQFQGNRKKTKSSINKPLTPINLNPKKTPGNTQNSRGILAEFQDFQWNAATVQGVSGEGFPPHPERNSQGNGGGI